MSASPARPSRSRRVARAATALCALFAVTIAVELAFTSVGATTGAAWTPPVEVASSSAQVGSLAAAGGQNATVAWVAASGGTASVHVAALHAADGHVTVGGDRVLASTTAGVDTVGVAGPYVVWDEHDTNRVRLYGPNGTETVSSALRVRNPTVAVIDGTPVAAWAAYRNGTYDLRVHTPRGSEWVAAEPAGTGSPTLVGGASRGYLVWREASNRTALVAPVTLGPSGPVVGRARSLGPAIGTGGFGPSTAGAIDAAPVPGGVRAVWTNQRVVTTAALRNESASATTTFGGGQRSRVASSNGSWVAAWLVESRSTGYDIAYRASDGAGGTAVALPGNSLAPTPVYAPAASLVWTENTGDRTAVLATTARAAPPPSLLDRLLASPGRFGFVALAALALGAVTLPLMPWTVVSALLAFLATTRFASDLALGALARLTGGTRAELRAGVADASGLVGFVVYAVGETVALVALLPAAGALPFSHPLAVTAIAAVGAVAARFAFRVRGFWRLVAVFAYLQTALLWTTALPAFL